MELDVTALWYSTIVVEGPELLKPVQTVVLLVVLEHKQLKVLHVVVLYVSM